MKAQRRGSSASAGMAPRRARPRSDDANAFIPDPNGGAVYTDDDLAETLGEGFLQGATQNDDAEQATLDGLVPEEIGGPFVETSAAEEFADGVDASNPPSANREPLPRPIAGLAHAPEVDEEHDNEDDESDV